MTKLKALAASAALLCAAGTAQAQAYNGNAYVGVGVDALEFDSYTLSGRLGYNFNDYVGVEGQAGFGISGDEEPLGTGTLEAKTDYFAGAFGVLRAPASEQIDVFARAGYVFSQASFDLEDNFSDAEAKNTADSDGFAIGAGAQFNFGPAYANGIRLEYTYLDTDELEFDNGVEVDTDGSDLWSISFIRRF